MKRKIIFKILLFAYLSLMLIVPALAETFTITTGYLSLQGVTDNTGSTYLWGTDEAGCLVQVIKVGSGGPYPPDKNGDPTPPDTLMPPTSYIGEGFLYEIEPANGRFATASPYSANPGERIIVRVWNSVEASQSTYYGDSPVLTVEAYMTDWNIKGTDNSPAFSTNQYFDIIPPDPPGDFVATPEVSGDIILTWTKSSSPDCVGTRIVWRTDRSPTMEWDYNNSDFTNVSTAAAQSYRHRYLTNGTRYYYGGFSYDFSSNFSTPAATTSEVSNDTLPPSVEFVSPSNSETGVAADRDIVITFNDVMSRDATENSFHIYPSVPSLSFSWNSQGTQMTADHGDFAVGTIYVCTVDSTASDDAGNQMGSDYTWWFRTLLGEPPSISNLKIDGWAKYPGDVISHRPRITASITDPELGPSGISTIEVSAGSRVYTFSTPEIGSVFRSGEFDFRFLSSLPPGVFAVTLEAWDVAGNSSRETISGLIVMGGEAKLIGPIVNYPNPFDSDEGTTFAYTLTIDADLEFYVYSIKGSLIYNVKISAGAPGGIAGYNEVFWNGKSNFGAGIGTGMYIVKVLSGGRVIESFKILVKNK